MNLSELTLKWTMCDILAVEVQCDQGLSEHHRS